MALIEKKYSWMSWFLYAFFLTMIGLLCLFSVFYTKDAPLLRTAFGKQILWAMVGIVFFVLIQRVTVNWLFSSSYIIYSVCLVLLIVVFAFEHQNVHRWIFFGNLRIQPSEIAKIGVVLALSRYLAGNKMKYLSFKQLSGTFLLVLCPAILILKEPDLGTSMVFVALWIAMIHLARMQFVLSLLFFVPLLAFVAGFQPMAFMLILVIIGLFLWFVKGHWIAKVSVFLMSLGAGYTAPLVWNQLANYQKERILIFIGLHTDPYGGAYQVIQSKLAIGSGGFWGKGLLKGSQTQLRFLPEQHTDFIFSVLGEEFGFVGVFVLLTIFFMFIIRGTLIAIKLKNLFANYLLAGCVVILSFQIVVNIAMTIGMAPVTGLPLPFLSYGGSSMCMSWILTGMIANLASQRQFQ